MTWVQTTPKREEKRESDQIGDGAGEDSVAVVVACGGVFVVVVVVVEDFVLVFVFVESRETPEVIMADPQN